MPTRFLLGKTRFLFELIILQVFLIDFSDPAFIADFTLDFDILEPILLRKISAFYWFARLLHFCFMVSLPLVFGFSSSFLPHWCEAFQVSSCYCDFVKFLLTCVETYTFSSTSVSSGHLGL